MRRMALALPVGALLGLSPVPAGAGFYTGNELFDACTTASSDPAYFENAHECAAYVAGAVDAFNTTREANKLKSCIPSGVTIKQLKDVTVDYLDAHPDDRNKSASTLVFSATRAKWPCAKPAPAKPAKPRRKRR